MSQFNEALLAKIHRVWEALAKPVFGVTFEQYLKGTGKLEPIPKFPRWPDLWTLTFDRDVLVDGRIVEKIGLRETCGRLYLRYIPGYAHVPRGDCFFAPYDSSVEQSGLRWMSCQDGRRYGGRTPVACRRSFAAFEVGMDAVEGVFAYIDDERIVKGHYMDLPGSVRGSDLTACLGNWGGGPDLSTGCYYGDETISIYGSASRGHFRLPLAA